MYEGDTNMQRLTLIQSFFTSEFLQALPHTHIPPSTSVNYENIQEELEGLYEYVFYKVNKFH